MKNVQYIMPLAPRFAPDSQLFLIVYLQSAFYDNHVLTRRLFHLKRGTKRDDPFSSGGVYCEKCAVFPAKLNQ